MFEFETAWLKKVCKRERTRERGRNDRTVEEVEREKYWRERKRGRESEGEKARERKDGQNC